MKPKSVTKRIVYAVLALLCAGVLVVANYFLNYYSLILHRFFAGDTATAGEGGAEVLESADLFIREASADSMVLLKNEGGYLPKEGLTKVNLFGWGSTDAGLLLTGGGSGGTSVTDKKAERVTLTEAFAEAGITINPDLNKAYEDFSSFDADWRSNGSTGANVTESLLNPGAGFYTEARMQAAYAYSPVAVATISRWGAENGGNAELVNLGKYTNGSILELTEEERAMFEALERGGFETVVLLNVCNNLELGFLEEYSCIKACLFMGIPGQSGAAAVPRILTGDVNPSGRTSDTLAYDYQTNNPVYANAYNNNDGIVYSEGIYFGYKWYETADAAGFFDGVENSYGTGYAGVVQYPFGYGLSYTTFEWTLTAAPASLTLTAEGTYTAKVQVTNTGDRAGKDVVELYGHAPYTEGGIEKAERVLLGFAKTPLLYPAAQAGEGKPNSCEVEITFTGYDLASYDDNDKNGNGFKGYELERGSYVIDVMHNAHERAEGLTFTLTAAADLTIGNDPMTGGAVVNRFTGESAYADCPTDGGAEYLSRANGFANYSGERARLNAPNAGTAGSSAGYTYKGYANADVAGIYYGADAGIYLVMAEQTDQNGNVTLLRPTPEMLSGADTTVKLTYNTDIIDLLLGDDEEIGDRLWDIIIGQMSQSDVKNLIGNAGFMTVELYSIGKPRCTDKDGPAGFNNNVTNPGQSSVYPVLPSESLLGCSWSTELAHGVGAMQAQVAAVYGINGWYGPGVNLHRSVYNSRNYEYYSEDAVLSGKLAAETIAGAKEGNLYCYLKHFAVSEAGQNPKNVRTWVNEQALRECYLRAFEIPVKEASANAMMSAFNCVGAVPSCYNHALLTDVLRTEWGFRGSVITDWFEGSGYASDQKAGVLAGNDLWLCGSTGTPANIDLNDPAVAYAARRSVKNILYTYLSTNVGNTSIRVNPEAHSLLLDFLWINLDVSLIAGCVAFLLGAVLPGPKKKKAGK